MLTCSMWRRHETSEPRHKVILRLTPFHTLSDRSVDCSAEILANRSRLPALPTKRKHWLWRAWNDLVRSMKVVSAVRCQARKCDNKHECPAVVAEATVECVINQDLCVYTWRWTSPTQPGSSIQASTSVQRGETRILWTEHRLHMLYSLHKLHAYMHTY